MRSHTGRVKCCQTVMTEQKKSLISSFLFSCSPLMHTACSFLCDLITTHIIKCKQGRPARENLSVLQVLSLLKGRIKKAAATQPFPARTAAQYQSVLMLWMWNRGHNVISSLAVEVATVLNRHLCLSGKTYRSMCCIHDLQLQNIKAANSGKQLTHTYTPKQRVCKLVKHTVKGTKINCSLGYCFYGYYMFITSFYGYYMFIKHCFATTQIVTLTAVIAVLYCWMAEPT